MDPQACITDIVDCLGSDDSVTFIHAFESLADWLRKGGFAPVVNGDTFPDVIYETCLGKRMDFRFWVGCRVPGWDKEGVRYAIMTHNDNPPKIRDQWVFVEYDRKGNAIHTYQMATK